MESRRAYGWGYTGNGGSGYEWELVPDEKDPCFGISWGATRSGTVFSTRQAAMADGLKWLKKASTRSGEIRVIRSTGGRFEY